MNPRRVKAVLILNYILFAIVLNSVGTVILMVQRTFGVTAGQASVLEGFKDIPVAITSFIVATLILRTGYKRGMLCGVALIGTACAIVPLVPTFFAVKLLFAIAGASFALMKVSVMATLGLVARSPRDHLSFLNLLEAFYMVGVVAGYLLFSRFIGLATPGSTSWFSVYYLIAGLCAASFLFILSTRIDESDVRMEGASALSDAFRGTLRLMALPLAGLFALGIFLSVLVEQSLMSWLPTFNHDVLNLSAALSVQMAAFLAGSQAFGRLVASALLRRVSWFGVVGISLMAAIGLVLLAMPMADRAAPGEVTSWVHAPAAAFVFPLIGFCLAPVYPAITSVMLMTLPRHQHGPMTGLVIVFSATGSTLGSVITGHLFQYVGGQRAFYASLIPITLLLLVLYAFDRQTRARTSGGIRTDA